MRFALVLGAAILIMGIIESADSARLDIGPVTDKRFEQVRLIRIPYDVSCITSRYTSVDDWKARAADLREQILASAGLIPLPKRTPLNAEIFDRIDRDDYTIEKVRFQSYPGLYVTGNLYRPKGDGPFPAVLNPHGHWKQGRYEDTEIASVPGRCINFAKQGYVAFTYDIPGYGDSKQIPHEHGGRKEGLWGISLGGLQLWNSIRSLDFLETLPDVDPNRMGCTGASGGGTQTFLLTAVDDRVKVSAPVNMISAHMQGGCPCENLPGLRIDTNNVEIAALMAPKPMVMVSATGDWTKDTPQIEFPAVRHIYRLFGAEDNVDCAQMDAGHNYFKDSREAVYSWFVRWLPENPLAQPVVEQPFEVEERENLNAMPGGVYPDGALDRDGLVEQLIANYEAQLEEHKPIDAGKLRLLRATYEPLLRRALSLPASFEITADFRGSLSKDGYEVSKLVLKEQNRGTEIPALYFVPGKASDRAVLLVHDEGKRHFLDREANGPGTLVAKLLKAGNRVLLIDCFNTGENVAPKDAPERNLDKDFFDTYNRTDTAERVFDILCALEYLNGMPEVTAISLAGVGRAGNWCLLARPFAPAIDRAVIDADGFDGKSDASYLDDLYVPCLRRAGDLRVAAALSAPGKMLIHNTQGRLDISWPEYAYASASAMDALIIKDAPVSEEEFLSFLGEVI